MSLQRRSPLLAILLGLLALWLVAPQPAAAGKGGKEKSDNDWAEIEHVGIPSMDQVFARVKEMQSSITTVESSLQRADREVGTALGLPEGTPLADAIADLEQRAQGKLDVVVEGGTPKLVASEAVPGNVQEAIDALNGFTADMEQSVTALQEIPSQAQAIVPDVQALPAKLPSEAKDLGAKLTEIPKMLSAVKNNVDATLQTPARAEAALSELSTVLNTITSSFGGSSQGGGSKAGGSSSEGQRSSGPKAGDRPGDRKTRPTGR